MATAPCRCAVSLGPAHTGGWVPGRRGGPTRLHAAGRPCPPEQSGRAPPAIHGGGRLEPRGAGGVHRRVGLGVLGPSCPRRRQHDRHRRRTDRLGPPHRRPSRRVRRPRQRSLPDRRLPAGSGHAVCRFPAGGARGRRGVSQDRHAAGGPCRAIGSLPQARGVGPTGAPRMRDLPALPARPGGVSASARPAGRALPPPRR